MTRAILFDKDGTLVDSFGWWVAIDTLLCRRLAAEACREPPGPDGIRPRSDELEARLLSAIGIENGRAVGTGLLATGTEDAILDGLYHALQGPALLPPAGPDVFKTQCRSLIAQLQAAHPWEPTAFPGAHELLSALRTAGRSTGLATSDNEADTLSQLSCLGWLELLPRRFCGDTCPEPKPQPWMVLEFARSCRLSPDQVAVVGDSAADLAMARLAGARFAGVLSGAGTAGELAGADLLVPSVADPRLAAWLELAAD